MLSGGKGQGERERENKVEFSICVRLANMLASKHVKPVVTEGSPELQRYIHR
jgi:hypothetical protein